MTTWIESATATTVTMIGTPELVGLNTTPIQPANPMVVLTANMSTATMAAVPRIERRNRAVTATMMRNTIGVSVWRSSAVTVR